MAQEFSITYAGLLLGGASTSYLIDGPMRYDEEYEKGVLSADIIVAKQSGQFTEAQFATACAAIEVAFHTPRGALLVTINAVTLISASHSGNTGLNTAPTIQKVGSDDDTGRSRRYRVSVAFGRPADLAGQSGRQSSTVEVGYDASRIRTVVVSGVYTALSSNASRAQYESASPAYFAALKTALGITNWEIVSESPSTDDADKYCAFRTVFREIVYNQSSAGADHANVVAHTVTFSRDIPAPGDSGDGKTARRQTVTATYECNVRDTQDLKAMWENTLRAYVLSQFNAKFPNRGYGVTDEVLSLDQTNQRVSARMLLDFAPAGATVLESVQSVEFDVDEGLVFTGAHDGDPDSYYVDQGKRVKTVTLSLQEMHVGLVPPSDNLKTLDVPFFGGGPDWHTTRPRDRSTPLWIGRPGGPQYAVTMVDRVVVKRYAKKPKRGGGGATTPSTPNVPSPGGGGATTPSQPNLPQPPRFGGS